MYVTVNVCCALFSDRAVSVYSKVNDSCVIFTDRAVSVYNRVNDYCLQSHVSVKRRLR